MKNLLKKLPLLLLVLVIVSSCSSVKVVADYDTKANFIDYKTFAFYKTGIDKAEISNLDKRRILYAIEAELLAKGFTKSENPDILVSFFTKSKERVNVYNNNGFGGYGGFGGFGGFGWGWNPWNNFNTITTTTEGTLFIDLIDANKKELIWQGSGTGYLVTKNMSKKEARIKEFVSKLMEKYPPELEQ